MGPLVHSEYYIGVFSVSKSPPKHILFNYYVDPLSSYPTLEQLSQLECDQWLQLGVRLGLGNDQLETIKKSQHPTAATLQAAKIKNIDMQWKDIVEALVSIGEYKLAESVCTQQGQQMTASVKLLAFVTFLFWEIPLLLETMLYTTSIIIILYTWHLHKAVASDQLAGLVLAWQLQVGNGVID